VLLASKHTVIRRVQYDVNGMRQRLGSTGIRYREVGKQGV